MLETVEKKENIELLKLKAKVYDLIGLIETNNIENQKLQKEIGKLQEEIKKILKT